jgi:hypothetical protein
MNYKGSLSGLVRFAKGKGKTVILKLLEESNKKNETSVQFGQVINIKNIIKNATHNELYNKDGTEKRIFTDRILIFTISRIIKKERDKLKKINSPSSSSKSIWTVRK